MKTFAFISLLFAWLIVAACGPTPDPPVTNAPISPAASPAADQFAATRAIYKEQCSKCHGETGAGGRVKVEGSELRVPNLTGEHARKPSDDKLAGKIANGDEEMPAFKDKLTTEQINDLVRFIRKEFQGQ